MVPKITKHQKCSFQLRVRIKGKQCKFHMCLVLFVVRNIRVSLATKRLELVLVMGSMDI